MTSFEVDKLRWWADRQLQGRCRRQRKIANNTYLQRLGAPGHEVFTVRLHHTNVVTIAPPGDRLILTSGGWKTLTTKERLNRVLNDVGWRVRSERGVWWLDNHYGCGQHQEAVFADGITIWRGRIVNKTAGSAAAPAREAALKKRIKAYAAKCVQVLPVPMPNGGDCWFCYLRGKNGAWGEMTHDREHLLSHVKTGYVFGSIVWNALLANGCKPQGGGSYWFSVFDGKHLPSDARRLRQQVGKFIYRYVCHQLGMTA